MWGFSFCCESFSLCREVILFAMSLFLFAVRFFFLPCQVNAFAVTVVGHRTKVRQTTSNWVVRILYGTTWIRAQSLFLALGALVRPGVNFLAHCQNFRRTASNTWSTYPERIVTLQKERLTLRVAIWAYSRSIKHNESENQNISHKN